jgi:MoaA/NifB/PqqE/SkfB family radical SAM enzyme
MRLVCCDAPHVVEAPVDRVLHNGVRLRHLPGWVCLSCGKADAPPVAPSPALLAELERVAASDEIQPTVLKIRERQGGLSGPRPALFDLAFGAHAGFVIPDVPGSWDRDRRAADLPGARVFVSKAIAEVGHGADGRAEPSLVYDTPSHPWSIQFEVTTLCNLACGYCSNRHLPARDHLPPETFARWLTQIDWRHVGNIDFTGLGEPTLHPHLPELVAMVRRHGNPAHVRLVSNGVALSAQRFEPLLDAGVTSMAISIDSLDATRFALARGGARIDRVRAHVEELAAWRDRTGRDDVELKIKAVLIDGIYEEAEALLAWSAQIGLDMPHFSSLDMRAQAQHGYEEALTRPQSVDVERFDDWARARWIELGGRPVAASDRFGDSAGASYFRHVDLVADYDVCRWVVDAAYVSINGSCLPCCEQMIDLPRGEIGSLERHTMSELWQGELLRAYRLPLALGLVPAGCAGCRSAPRSGVPLAGRLPVVPSPSAHRGSST